MCGSVAVYKQIKGPPGIGKTEVSAAIVMNWVRQLKNYRPNYKYNSIFNSLPLSRDKDTNLEVVANTVKVAGCCGANAGLENSMKALLKKAPEIKIIKIGRETEGPLIEPYTLEREYIYEQTQRPHGPRSFRD